MIKNITPKTKVTQEINRSNYYSNRMDWAYMSATLLKNFMQCEAQALHSLKNPVENDALPLLVGNYLHSHFESDEAFESFCNEHRSKLFTRTNTLRADFKKADKMIKRLESDAMFNFFYNSPENEKEVILDGELYGVPWKARIDSLNVKDGYFCDLKTSRTYTSVIGALSDTNGFRSLTSTTTLYKWELTRSYCSRSITNHLLATSLPLIKRIHQG